MTRLITERLEMRLCQPSDFDALYDLVSDFDVVRMTSSWPHPADPDLTRERCQPFDAAQGMVGVVLLDDTLIGSMGLAQKPDEDPHLGYMFARPYWGNGYATEMCHALIDHCWATYDWPMICADAFADNPASVHVLEKLGFEELDSSTGHSVARGESSLLQRFQLLRPQS
ncbi:GNAT family N-acetyltransferase [Aliiroseovarius sp. S253]|uniref:GNAT family N-acetyltransferase n=1 Tax=Aliiroseovarius sp. S253 TaxID=3415133 RepID=UPI003C7EBCC5